MNRELFVGRERELGRLREAFEAACQGEARVVAVAGEPGIGKTRLAEELEGHAREQGALVLWGRVRETAGAPPYWPWMQAGRTLERLLGPAGLTALLGAEVVELQRLFPGLRDLIPDLPPPAPALESESARFRLFEALTATYHRLAAQQPVVLVLDDLQWADAATLLLLQHLAAESGDSRLLVLALYRSGEVDREHPLSATLAELTRLPGFERLLVSGLSEEETAQCVQAAADVPPAAALERRIHEVTEGNPFFTREVVALLNETGAMGGEPLTATPLPAGVRDVLGRHLARVSDEARKLLYTGAVIGREFTHDTLALLVESAGVDLVPLLEEAVRERVIEATEEVGRYRFVHALMHEALLADIAAPRRALLHAQVGEALERRWGERAERYASRLATHFTEAAALGPAEAEKALRYHRLAGEQAEAQFAWADAAAHYERCIELLDLIPDEALLVEASLLEALGRSQMAGAAFRVAWQSLTRAIDAYRARGEWAGAARATHLACGGLGEGRAPWRRRLALVDAALQAPGERDARLEAALLAERALNPLVAPEERSQNLTHARRMAEAGPHADVLTAVLAAEAETAWQGWRLRDAVRLWGDVIARYEQMAAPQQGLQARANQLLALHTLGDLSTSETAYEQMLARARLLRSRTTEQAALGNLAGIAWARGDFRRAYALLDEIPDGPFYLREVARTILSEATGDLTELEALLPDPALARGIEVFLVHIYGSRARALHRFGDLEGARREVAALVEVARSGLDRPFVATGIAIGGQAFIDLADADFLRATYDALSRADECRRHGVPVDEFRGALALRLDLVDEAEQHFRTGANWCERERCPVELGRCLLGLAEVAERRGERPQALAHLDRAAVLFEQHGARLYLDDARAMRERIEAASRGPAYPDGLSPREVEVLRLVAAGKSNREIAEELVLSVRTVERHVANIYAKADLHGRAEAATYALRHGLDAVEPTAT